MELINISPTPAAAAVIAEFNLFHNGHKILLRKIKEKLPGAPVAAIMSGSYVQRGEAAVIDKYLRAKAAVLCGYDLVIELPPPWSISSASDFARGGIDMAALAGVFTHLAFGCRGGSEYIRRTAEIMTNERFFTLSEECAGLADGSSEPYMEVLSRRYEEVFEEQFPRSPNDILAVEYLKHLRGKDIKPLFISRETQDSATESRRLFFARDFEGLKCAVPAEVFELYKTAKPMSLNIASAAILYNLRRLDIDSAEALGALPHGLPSRIKKAARISGDYNELIARLPTKTYSAARLRRAVLYLLFGIKGEHISSSPGYINILAASEKGRELIARIPKEAKVISRPAELKKIAQTSETAALTALSDEFSALCAAPAYEAGWALKARPYFG
ncbi:MAG TPA: nucleotidyltransferase family protein [Clostridiales bacterium]|jgi:predicted nucleotidyltransferase|nr:nucleotidyltransferase family protein [Clostridiales bacterium]